MLCTNEFNEEITRRYFELRGYFVLSNVPHPTRGIDEIIELRTMLDALLVAGQPGP